MTSEEIKNMSFEDFRTQIEGMEEVQKLTADGTERYGIYKHDVCYVNRDGIERTLQMIVPETNAKAPKIYPAILYVQGSAWRKQDNYKRLGAMADLARRGFVTAILQYRESDLATFPAPVEDAKTGVRFLRKHAEEYRIDPSQVFIMGDSSGGNTAFIAGGYGRSGADGHRCIWRIFLQGKCNRRFLRSYMRTDKRRFPNYIEPGRTGQSGRNADR